jgi:hypothetical protein
MIRPSHLCEKTTSVRLTQDEHGLGADDIVCLNRFLWLMLFCRILHQFVTFLDRAN